MKSDMRDFKNLGFFFSFFSLAAATLFAPYPLVFAGNLNSIYGAKRLSAGMELVSVCFLKFSSVF